MRIVRKQKKVYAIYEKTREENYSLLNLQELFFKEEENGGEVWKEYEIAGDETEAADLTVTNPQNSQKWTESHL